MDKLKVGIIGATGYTGSELVRILLNHPQAEISLITSESKAGRKFSDIHTAFVGLADMVLQPLAAVEQHELDVVFLALPHGISMNFVKKYSDAKFKIIDLSGDFRLSSASVYESWYKNQHIFPSGFKNAAYGLPELYADKIKASKLVANPGCFPTSAILGLYPLIKNKLIHQDDIIIDAKTGATGAGVKPSNITHFSNVHDNFKPYGLKFHRHTIEIEEKLQSLDSANVMVQFTPHLLPIDRGIIATIYSRPLQSTDTHTLQKVYKTVYADQPFIRVRNEAPSLKDVKASNYCDVYCTYDERTNRIITVAAIDNLVKGAAGQAVHNMNLMFNLEETTGLNLVPVMP